MGALTEVYPIATISGWCILSDMANLKIASGLALPASTATQKLAWLGTTGSGKTYGASKLAEEFWEQGAQFVVLDPVGVWYGLRLAKDGKKPSDIDIPILGGLHGDIPLESTSGAMIADLIVDKTLSIILDVSQFESDAQKARFASDFASRFFFRKKAAPSAVHLFIEECQEFVPQNPQRGEERMLHDFIRMQKLGRNFGIGSSYITQRPQEVNKKALNMAQTLFVFRTTGTHERVAIEKWIEDKSLDESIAQDLPKLATGTCHVWSPEFLKISETVKILEKDTFNASATPEVGKKAVAARLADIDIPLLQKEMQATIEKAKHEDPKLLHKEIAQLRAELSKKLKEDPDYIGKMVEKHTREAVMKRDEEWAGQMKLADKEIARLGAKFVQISGIIGGDDSITAVFLHSRLEPIIEKREVSVEKIKGVLGPAPRQLLETDITGPETRILEGIAMLNAGMVQYPSKPLIAAAARYSVKSSSFVKALSQLRSREYLDSNLQITEAGWATMSSKPSAFTRKELHVRVLSILSGPEKRILEYLLWAEKETADEVLAEGSGYSRLSSSYVKAKSQLRSKGLIVSNGPMYRAADMLFI